MTPMKEILNPAQLEVARLVSYGLCNKEIATIVGVSEQAIKNRLRKMFDQLGLESRVTLAVRYVREI